MTPFTPAEIAAAEEAVCTDLATTIRQRDQILAAYRQCAMRHPGYSHTVFDAHVARICGGGVEVVTQEEKESN